MDDLDFTGKKCPCPQGWYCEEATQTCAAGDAPEDVDASLQDAAIDVADEPDVVEAAAEVGADAELDVVDARPPSVVVTNLHAAWTTPNWVRWEWESAGVPDELFGFELVTGTSEQDVRDRIGSAVVWTADQNPELGRFFLPATGDEDPVVATLTSGHAPDTVYYGQLSAIDTGGNRSVSEVASTRTIPTPGNVAVVFSETDIGWGLPGSVALSDRFPYAGTYHYDFMNVCETGETSCYENVGRQGFTVPVTEVSQTAFASTAYLEVALAVEGTTTSYWSQVRIRFLDPDKTVWSYDTWTIRPDGTYHLYQIPLREFQNGGSALPFEVLADPLWEMRLGGLWEAGARVSLDEIRVWW